MQRRPPGGRRQHARRRRGAGRGRAGAGVGRRAALGGGEVVGGDALPEGSFTGVTATADGWLATSTDMRGGAVWALPDGRRWAQVPGSGDWFAGLTLQGIAVDGPRIVVAATALADHETSLHTSTDGGRTWRTGPPRVRTLDHTDATVTDLAVVAGDVVVVGTRGDAPVIERRTGDVGD